MVLLLLLFFALTGLGLVVSVINGIVNFALRMRKGKQPEEAAPPVELAEKNLDSAHHRIAFEWMKTKPYEDVSIVSEDGLVLRGWYFAHPNARGSALCLPGWTDKKEEFYGEAKLMFDCGLNVLVPDERAMGQSEGQFCTFGDKESRDARLWLDELKKRGSGPVVVYGRSMGAATTMLLVSSVKDPSIVCAIEDCGYTSMRDEMLFFVRERVRWVPAFLYPLLAWLAAPILLKRADCHIERADPMAVLPRCAVPMLFIHGREDTFVPFDMMPDLHKAHPGPKEKLEVEGAKHARNLAVGGQKYIDTVKKFIDTYLV